MPRSAVTPIRVLLASRQDDDFRSSAEAFVADTVRVPLTELRLIRRRDHQPLCRIGRRRGPFVSFSSCADWSCVAVCEDAPLGIDIEFERALSVPYSAVAEEIFHPRERAILDGLSSSAARRFFFRCWTRKEAIGKTLGLGLLSPMRDIDGGAASARPRPGAWSTIRLPDERSLRVTEFGLPFPGWAGALATFAPNPRLSPVVETARLEGAA